MSRVDLSSLLKKLSTEYFVSGEELAKEYSVSRTSIAKQIKLLQEVGVDVYSVQRSGYKLGRQVSLLEKEKVLGSLNDPDQKLLTVETIIDSTNDYVKERAPHLPDGFVCIAQGQKKGRGRQGKVWVSPFASNIYLTMKWRFQLGFQSLSGLSLAIGVATIRTVDPFIRSTVTLKWPNDVYINGQKVSGTLVEVAGNNDGSCDAIIGIGLNVDMQNKPEIDQPWTDLQSHSKEKLNINLLAAAFINNLRDVVACFVNDGFAPFVEEWESHDHFKDKQIVVLNGKNKTQCVSRGISATGALVVEIKEGEKSVMKELFGGEISVRSS